MSLKFNQRPSNLLSLGDDPYAAYCLDEACFAWGTHVDMELELAARDPKDLTKKEYRSAVGRRTRVFDKLMHGELEAEVTTISPKRFRDPAGMFSGKVARKGA